jgi:hypothetical protein
MLHPSALPDHPALLSQPFWIPSSSRDALVTQLEVTERAYETCKTAVAKIETERLTLATERESIKTDIALTVIRGTYASVAAGERDEKRLVLESQRLREITTDEYELKVWSVSWERDLSIARERVKSLRSALDSWTPEPTVTMTADTLPQFGGR